MTTAQPQPHRWSKRAKASGEIGDTDLGYIAQAFAIGHAVIKGTPKGLWTNEDIQKAARILTAQGFHEMARKLKAILEA